MLFLLWSCKPFNSLGPFSSSFIGDPVLSPMDDCEHPLLYLSGTGRASQETAISGSCQQALLGICNSVWVWCLYIGWISRWGSLWMASALHLVSVSPPMGILFHLVRRTQVSTLWSFFFLSFIWSVNCILGIPSFWDNIHLSLSTYHVCSFVIGLPHSE